VGYTQLSALYVYLAAVEAAHCGAGNEIGFGLVVLDEPSGRQEAEIALDHHKIASGEALQTS
jgi:hypothetical protein